MTDPSGGFVIGVDAGGTKTLALLAAPDGTLIGRGAAGPGNYQSAGADAALAALEAAISAAVDSAGKVAGAKDFAIAALCLGMAGVDRPEDRAWISTWAQRRFPNTQLRIANDAQLVLAAGTPENTGIAVISGTGSMVYAAGAQGISARAGGWGYLLGDEGSGYAVGLAGMRAVVRAHDGRGPSTLLTGLLLAHFGLSDASGLVGIVYRSGLTRPEIARLSILVDVAAQQNDPAALEIFAQAADELALAARAAAARLSLDQPIPCALAGGGFTKGKTLLAAFGESTRRGGPLLEPVQLVAEPALGAVKIALGMIDR